MTRLVVAFSLLFLRRLRIIEVVQGSFNRKMTRQELGPSEVQIREQVTTPDKTVEKEYRFLLCSRQVPLDSHSCRGDVHQDDRLHRGDVHQDGS
jgi:hypothetical protein